MVFWCASTNKVFMIGAFPLIFPWRRLNFSMNRSIFIILLFSAIWFPQSASADWMVIKHAEVRNAEKYLFRVTIGGGGVIWGWLHLPKDIPGAFSFKLPIYQVDDNKVREIPSNKQGTLMDKQKKRWIRWKFSGTIQKPGEELMEIMTGKELTIQYYMPDGAIYETTFLLTGAKEAIEEVLSIN
jgi:hypothetical protein